MNCHNGEKYLKESIESVLFQTYENWELIFWDNKSEDESGKIFKSYTDKRFRYFYSEKYTSCLVIKNSTPQIPEPPKDLVISFAIFFAFSNKSVSITIGCQLS